MKIYIFLMIFFIKFCFLFPLETYPMITSYGKFNFGDSLLNQREFLNIMGGYEKSEILILKEYNYLVSNLYITFTLIENDKLLCGLLATNYKRKGNFLSISKNNWKTKEGFELGQSYSDFVKIYGLAKRIESANSFNYDSIAVYYNNNFELLFTKIYLKNNIVVGIEIWNGP